MASVILGSVCKACWAVAWLAAKLASIAASDTEIVAFKVYNTLGQEVTSVVSVLSSNELETVLDLSTLPRGLYNVLTSTSANQVHKHTIILE